MAVLNEYAGLHAEYRREDFIFPRTQKPGTRLDIKSPAPLRHSYALALVGAIVGAIVARMERPYLKHRAF